MKKIIISSLMCSMLTMNAWAEPGDHAGQVVGVTGAPMIKASDSDEWFELSTGDDISVGDRIRTEDGKAKLLLVDDTVLTLDVKSDLQISEHLFKPKQKQRVGTFSLFAGRVKALVGSFFGSTDVKVNTPTAVAGVRGTHFVVEVIPPETAQMDGGTANDGASDTDLGSTRVQVLEGLVNLANSSGGSMEVGELMTGRLSATSIMETARQMNASEVVGLRTSLSVRPTAELQQKSAESAANMNANGESFSKPAELNSIPNVRLVTTKPGDLVRGGGINGQSASDSSDRPDRGIEAFRTVQPTGNTNLKVVVPPSRR